MLTDTTFWSDLLAERRARRTGPAGRFIAAHRAQPLRVSIITWAELAEFFQNSAVETTFDGILQYGRILEPEADQLRTFVTQRQVKLVRQLGVEDHPQAALAASLKMIRVSGLPSRSVP